jgi:predicted house-cleaning NTP pyrophosphatase (Maf/HAM1 superfamily)
MLIFKNLRMGCNMRKKLLVLALFFLWTVPVFSQSVGTAWVRKYNGPGNGDDNASGLAVDGFGNVYVTGKSWGSGIVYKSAMVASGLCQYYDYATIKYYPNGDTAWVRRYNGSGNNDDVAASIALDGSGNVYVTGQSYGNGTGRDYATIKYYPNGDTAWVRRYNGSGKNDDVATSIALDGGGNVYVTGQSYGSGTGEDYATIKYYPNGDTAWVRRYNGSGNNDDVAASIALDGSGNVYVTGQSYGSGTGEDYATIKYYPNGDTAWVRRYNGPENGDDKATDISLDDSGKVYVTGTTDYGSGFDDFATIAYYPNGDTAWVRRYNGLDNGCDRPSAIAVDDSNNVYLTGMSEGIGTSHDFVTIRYRLFKSRSDTLWFMAYSPVDLIIIAPNEDSVGVNFNCIPNATYNDTIDLDSDGEYDDLVTIPNPLIGSYMVKVIAEPGGTGTYTEAVKINGNEERPMALNSQVPEPGQVDTVFYPVTEYLRGDPNRDGKKNVSDVIYLINYVVKQGPLSEPVSLGDVDCNGDVTIADIVYLINYLFKEGNAPCS